MNGLEKVSIIWLLRSLGSMVTSTRRVHLAGMTCTTSVGRSSTDSATAR